MLIKKGPMWHFLMLMKLAVSKDLSLLIIWSTLLRSSSRRTVKHSSMTINARFSSSQKLFYVILRVEECHLKYLLPVAILKEKNMTPNTASLLHLYHVIWEVLKKVCNILSGRHVSVVWRCCTILRESYYDTIIIG